MKRESIYAEEATRTWGAEDSPWKAEQILRIIRNNGLHPRSIAEIGCGAGAILEELSRKEYLAGAKFSGYDIAPQAIRLAKQRENGSIKFFQENMLARVHETPFDLLLVIDVVEHVPDYMGFLDKCRQRATYKVFHIPLDIHLSSVLRNSFIRNRYTIGHIHYFTAEWAIAALKDAGYELVDWFYTGGALALFRQHPSAKRAAGNLARRFFATFSAPLAARLFGGYSLLVLAK